MTAPVVFLGPSMPIAEAVTILDADYRPAARRGDLDHLVPGTLVGLIDGVFDQNLAVSPREVRTATRRGVVIVGGASMGALRAAEVPEVCGVGTVYAWYRDGVISRDDEVALTFDPETGRPLTVPTVNVRYAVERLARPGTIDRRTADELVAAAAALPFTERTYPRIIAKAGLSTRQDSADLIRLLEAIDLKRLDARSVLETVHRQWHTPTAPRVAATAPQRASQPATVGPDILIWESGDRISWDDLVRFVAHTGKLETYAARRVSYPAPTDPDPAAAQRLLTDTARRWGWLSPEEARVTLADLSIDLTTLNRRCLAAARDEHTVATAIRYTPAILDQDMRVDMFLNDLALKREAMRLGALRHLAAQTRDPCPADRADAIAVLCRANRCYDAGALRQRWAALALDGDDFVELVARARRTAYRILHAERPYTPIPRLVPPAPKPAGELRFCLDVSAAAEQARRLAAVIGVTRIGMIGELGELGGVQVAQAARPDGSWSSSYGSGKSLTLDGAVTGSVLEELEKWAQERFEPAPHELVVTSWSAVAEDPRFVRPDTLALPYDSAWTPQQVLSWFPVLDLLTGDTAYVPVDVLLMTNRPHDICWTSRGGRKHLATNGLGSGFSLAEAALHAACEYVERHTQRLADLLLANPGGLGPHPYRFLDLVSAPDRLRGLAERLSTHRASVRVLDITSDIGIPTFAAAIIRDGRRADGYGTHPNAPVAAEMALLEAAQTIASSVAGGREDLTIHARSLGRHERPRPIAVDDAWLWRGPDPPIRPLTAIAGFTAADVTDDLAWTLDRIRAAGADRVLLADLTVPATAPAHVVRVLIPGLETNNPFHTGPRARLTLLGDLVPQGGWR